MANLGLHYIYRELREMGASVERFFASPIPYRSVERDALLERFQLILAGVAYEGDIPVLARWLDGGGVSASRTGRDSESSPLVGAGGALTYINPLSLSGICDFIVLGDGVPAARHLAETLRRGGARKDVLKRLAEHPSIFVPSLHNLGGQSLEIARRDINADFGHGNWVTPRTVFGDTLLLELQRGCGRDCGYCTLPSCFAPMRQRDVNLIKRDLERVSAECDFSRIGLVTPEAGDYRRLEELLGFAESLGKGVSFASLRVDGLTRNMMRAIIRGGRRAITIAPESWDDLLRARCGKKFTNDKIVDVLREAKAEGMRSAKLYFMLGLPGEDDGHVLSISRLCRDAGGESGLKITASVSFFVPKPGTAWECAEFGGEKNLKRKYSLLSRSFRGASKAELQGASVREACFEYALAWASAGTSEIIASGKLSSEASYRRLVEMADRGIVASELERLGISGGERFIDPRKNKRGAP
jgi:radical SAM superfamily enzyme YgiQ (UPF0313 family)